jgi:hypothetical protein
MPPQDTITLAVAVLATVVVVLLLLPNIFAVLGLSNLRCGFTGGPEDANAYWPYKIDDDLYREMLALGFQPLGTYWEQLPFTRRFEEFVFTRPGEKCFGVLCPNNQIMPRRGSFLTVFETGGVVFSKNYCGGVEVQEGDFLATGAQTNPARELPPPTPAPAPAGASWNPIVFLLVAGLLAMVVVRDPGRWFGSDQGVVLSVLGALAAIGALLLFRPRMPAPPEPAREPADLDVRITLAETLARHRLNVNRFIAAGQQTPAVFDCNEFLATQQRYHSHPRLRSEFQSSMCLLLVSKLIVLTPLPGIFFFRRGVLDPLPWSLLLGEGLVGLYLRHGCSSATVISILRGVFGNPKAS